MLEKILNIVKTEPAMISAAAQTVLGLVVTLGFSLTAGETGAIMAAFTALLGLATAVSARPFAVSALTGLVSAVVTLLLAFGVHNIQPNLVASINAGIVAVSALVLRGHITPVASLGKHAADVPVPAGGGPAAK